MTSEAVNKKPKVKAIKKQKPKKFKFSPGWVFVYIIMLGLVCFTALPLIYLICTAFKPLDELFAYPPQFFVRKPTLKNFTDLLTTVSGSSIPFTRYIFNSLFTTVFTVAGTVVVSSLGAYGLVIHNPPGSKAIFAVVVAALMFSAQVTSIPTYMVINNLGLIDTYWALIVPKLAVAYNFFLMKQFMESFPRDILEAARIDGANEWTTFAKIVMPNMKPAWATLVVFSFISNWNDYMGPLIYTTSQVMKTLPIALNTIAGGAGTIARTGAMGAASLLTTMPTIIVFTAMKAKVMETMTHSGIKA
ncbi:MAG: carbohydrate ABC transporter permease [Clostridia bacterium]|nr:carbohydrate ABC transporter permease [Clostridia bacterium]